MDRRRIALRWIPLSAAVLLSAAALMSCPNALSLFDAIQTEVKISNDKFLVVKGVVSPTAQTDVNPGVQMRIDFDRAVDPATITAGNIVLTGPGTFSLILSLSADNKILYVQPDPYLSDLQDYTFTVKAGVKGSGGEDLQQEYSWTFKTGTYPAGSVKVTDLSKNELTYTNVVANKLTVRCNLVSASYRLSTTDFLTNDPTDPRWKPTNGTEFVVYAPVNPNVPDFSPGDGVRTIYIQFTDALGTKFSLAKSDTVLLDQTPPAAPTIPAIIYINSYSPSGTVISVGASDSGSGIAHYDWTLTGPVTAAPLDSASPTIGAGLADGGPYTISLVVRDGANNASPSSASAAVIRDTVPPGTPVFDTTTYLPYTTSSTPRWDWNSGGGGETTPRYRYLVENIDKWRGTPNSYYIRSTKEPLKDGTYNLLVKELDAAGNESGIASMPMTINPFTPPNKTTGVPSTAPKYYHTLQWSAVAEAGSYEVYYGTTLPKTPVIVVIPSSGDPFLDTTLARGTYIWCVVTKDAKGNVIDDSRKTFGDVYTFRTQ